MRNGWLEWKPHEFHQQDNYPMYKELQNNHPLNPASMQMHPNGLLHDQKNWLLLMHTNQEWWSSIRNPPINHPWCNARQDKFSSVLHTDSHRLSFHTFRKDYHTFLLSLLFPA